MNQFSGITIIFVLFFCANGQTVTFSGLENQIIPLEEVVYITCHARGNAVYWHINGTDPQTREQDYIRKGFQFTYDTTRHLNMLNEHNNTMRVEARLGNNNTLISCIVFIYGQPDFSQEETLVIAGPPLVPNLDHKQAVLTNDSVAIVHTLTWDAPFSWSNFPIISYVINITNLMNGVTNVTTIRGNESNHTTHLFTSYGDTCYGIDISVIAINTIGDSEPATLSVGHPIIIEKIGEIETTITFSSSGAPHVWLSFMIPDICPEYQTGTYNITMYDVEGQALHHFGPTQFMGTQEYDNTIIVREIKTGFVKNRNYSITVSTESIGISHSKEKMFNTLFTGCHIPIEDHETGSVRAAITETSESCVIASSAAGGVLMILFLALIVLILVKILRRTVKKKSFRIGSNASEHQSNVCRSVPTSLKIQTSNPIYEGAIYETTPGESAKSLPDSTISPNTPSAEQICRYTFDLAPQLPAPRKTSLKKESCESSHDPSLASLKPAELSASKFDSLSADEYMAMTTVISNKDANDN